MISSGAARLLQLLKDPLTTEVPKGWKTIQQWGKETGLSIATVRQLLRAGTKDGTIKRKQFLVRCSGRSSYPVMHYFLKP